MKQESSIRAGSALLAIAITLAIWFVIPVPEGVTPAAWHLLALFIGTIAAIIGKAMPIGALAMIAIALVAITGDLVTMVGEQVTGRRRAVFAMRLSFRNGRLFVAEFNESANEGNPFTPAAPDAQ